MWVKYSGGLRPCKARLYLMLEHVLRRTSVSTNQQIYPATRISACIDISAMRNFCLNWKIGKNMRLVNQQRQVTNKHFWLQLRCSQGVYLPWSKCQLHKVHHVEDQKKSFFVALDQRNRWAQNSRKSKIFLNKLLIRPVLSGLLRGKYYIEWIVKLSIKFTAGRFMNERR